MNTSVYRLALPVLLFTAVAHAAVNYDLVADFNTSNNPNAYSGFSYGAGGTPAAFVLDGNVALNCLSPYSFVNPTACVDNGLAFPNVDAKTWNGGGTSGDIGTVIITPTDVRLDPTGTAGDIIRFTAPTTGVYSLSGSFDAADTNHITTTVEIFVNSTMEYSNTVGGPGSVDSYSLSGLSLTAGNTIDFIVASDADGASYLSTGL